MVVTLACRSAGTVSVMVAAATKKNIFIIYTPASRSEISPLVNRITAGWQLASAPKGFAQL
jgi:hypothetical protein